MKFIISGKNLDVTEGLREKATKKLKKIEKFFSPETEAHITMSVEKNRQIFEVTIIYRGVVFRAELESEDMYSSIDKAVDILERQIMKNKTKLQKKLHESAFKNVEVKSIIEENEYNVVKTKKFAVKPMSVEEAIMQLDLVGHEFFVFTNSETKEVNVIYKRKGNGYGLIEPEY